MSRRSPIALACAAAALHAGVAAAQTVAAPAPPAGTPPAGIRLLLAAQMETTLASPIAGRLRALDAALGARFAKGDVLVALECDEQSARLRMGEAELAAASEQHQAKLRLQGLQQAGELEVALAAAAQEKAQAQVGLFAAQVAQCSIAAPFDGRTVKLHVRPFQGVNAGQPLLDVIRSGPLKARVNVPSRWLSWLRTGTRFDIDIDETRKRYGASVSAINGRVDPVSQTVEIEGALDVESAELLAGMSGTARFRVPR
jgi:RND family efflux transporter MFP subunit